MTSKRFLSIAFTFIILVGAFPNIGLSSGEDWEINSLKGIKKISPSVGVSIQQTDKNSTIENTLRTLTELKLRLAGIEVGDAENDFGDALIGVSVTGVQTDESPNAYYTASYLVELGQLVILNRNNTIHTFGSTWSGGGMIANRKEHDLESHLKEEISSLMDIFLNDYLKANPK